MIDLPFTALADAAPGGLMLADASGNCVFVNAQWQKLTGNGNGNGSSMDWIAGVHAADRPRVETGWRDAVTQGEEFVAEFRTAGARTRERWVAARARPYHDAGGRLLGFVATADDVTPLHESGRALQEGEDRLRRALRGARVGTWGWEIASGRVTWSDNVEDIFGIPRGSFDGTYEVFRSLVYPPDSEVIDAALRQSLEHGTDYRVQHRIVISDGEIRWLEGAGQVTRDDNGCPLRLDGTVVDITERKRAEQALQEREARLRLALDASHIGIWAWNMVDDVITWDERMYEMFGMAPSEQPTVAGFLDRVHPGDRHRVEENLELLLAQGESVDSQYRIVLPDGSVRHIVALGAIERDAEGNPLTMVGTCLDATARIEAEEALRQSEVRYRTVVAALAEGIALYDRSSNLLAHNEAAERILGLTAEQMSGRSLIDPQWRTIHEDGTLYPAEEYPAALTLNDGEPRLDCVMGVFKPGGELTWISINTEPLFAEGEDTHYGVVASFTDITEAKVAEQRIRRLNAGLEARVHARTVQLEMANRELESFASSVSHDLRAPIRAMTGFGEILRAEYGDHLGTAGRGYIERIVTAGSRMGQLIDDLLALSRWSRSEIHKESVDLTALVEQVVADLRRATPDREVEVTVEQHLVVEADPRLLRVVIDNLLGNAWKFTVDATVATIAFGRTSVSGQFAYYVRDNGAGFDMQYAGKLFGPFQRLHGEHEFEGTGIGLATVQRIVERHGGRVWGEGDVGQGATFYFTV